MTYRDRRATIEDYGKGKIGEIFFNNYGEHDGFVIINPKELGEDIGKDLCDGYDSLNIDNITIAARDAVDNLRGEIIKHIYRYVKENFEGEFEE